MSDTANMSDILAEQVDRLFSATVARPLLQSAEAGKFPTDLWRAAEELGLGGALVPEAAGGAGLSGSDVGGVMTALGFHVAPIPLGETMIASWGLGLAGLETPSGVVIPIEDTVELDASGAVSGVASNVPWAEDAGHFVAIARRGGERFICLIEKAGASIAAGTSIGRDPRATVSLDRQKPVAIVSAPAVVTGGLRPALAILRTAQIAGALSRALGMSIEYANTRVQFGKPIGKFQVLQHMMAEFACEAAAAGVASAMALRSLGKDGGELTVAAAKVRAGIAATKGAAAAHAIHGAIGVTDEHSLHYLTRRLWQWRDDAGSEHFWAERLGRSVLAQPGNAVWPAVVSLA